MRISMGQVVAPSGKILLIDAGLLNLWSHDQVPELPGGILSSDEATARANRSVDLELVGPGADLVAVAMQRGHPRFIYDIPEDGVDALRSEAETVARNAGVEVSVRVHAPRIPHRRWKRVGLSIRAAPAKLHDEFATVGVD